MDQPETPKYLFRYRSNETKYFWDETDRAIFNSEFFLAPSTHINDPFEFSPIYEASDAEAVLEQLKGHYKNNPVFSKQVVENQLGRKVSRQEFRRDFRHMRPSIETANLNIQIGQEAVQMLPTKARLACFSETNQSTPMWGHYANNHYGICLQFEQMISLHQRPAPLPFKVAYSDVRPNLSTIDLGVFTGRAENSEEEAEISGRTHEAMYLRKSSHWSYEQEWRAFETDDAVPHYVVIPSMVPKSIAFGVRAKDEDVRRAVERYGSHVQVLKASCSSEEFEFDFKKVDC